MTTPRQRQTPARQSPRWPALALSFILAFSVTSAHARPAGPVVATWHTTDGQIYAVDRLIQSTDDDWTAWPDATASATATDSTKSTSFTITRADASATVLWAGTGSTGLVPATVAGQDGFLQLMPADHYDAQVRDGRFKWLLAFLTGLAIAHILLTAFDVRSISI
jgi:hypothetical protein